MKADSISQTYVHPFYGFVWGNIISGSNRASSKTVIVVRNRLNNPSSNPGGDGST